MVLCLGGRGAWLRAEVGLRKKAFLLMMGGGCLELELTTQGILLAPLSSTRVSIGS